jgi:hypothetical protein
MTSDDQSPPDPNVVISDTAALAANSAERAQAAAADAIQHAQNAAAGVAVVAAEETRQSEERLAQWQTSIVRQNEETAAALRAQSEATQVKLAEAMDKILSIQTRLEKPPESPPSPESGSSAASPPAGAEGSEAHPEAPPSEPKPAKRKAHRWI